MKVCSKCGLLKALSDFHKNKARIDGYKETCKICRLAERRLSYEKRKEKAYTEVLNYNNVWRKQNPEKAALHAKHWVSSNREKVRIFCNSRYSRAKQARVSWANKQDIKDIYLEAAYMQLTVDHIIPLKHPLVCGLHVAENLQLLTKKENSSKNNYWEIS